MIILVKSLPATPEGKRGIKMARDMAADIVFMQNGIYFALDEMIDGYCGTAYAIKEDVYMRGMQNQMRSVKVIDWDQLIDMMVEEDKILGAF